MSQRRVAWFAWLLLLMVLVLCSGGGGGGGYYCSFFVVSAEESVERFVTYMSIWFAWRYRRSAWRFPEVSLLASFPCLHGFFQTPIIHLSLSSCSSSSSPWLFLSFFCFFSFFSFCFLVFILLEFRFWMVPNSATVSIQTYKLQSRHFIWTMRRERERERNWKKQWRLGGREDGSRCKFCEMLL